MMNHTLSAGDSLDLLSFDTYGTIQDFRAIAEANDLDIFDTLPFGRTIQLPELYEVVPLVIDKALDLSGISTGGSQSAYKLIDWVL